MSGFGDLIGYEPPVPATKGMGTGLCQPASFCAWSDDGKTCGCSATSAKDTDFSLYPLLRADSGFLTECNNVCQTWAVKDLDCPKAGCYGFAVTLPSGFNIDSPLVPTPQPTPACFPLTKDWTSPGFVPAKGTVAGKQCTYSAGPAQNFCGKM